MNKSARRAGPKLARQAVPASHVPYRCRLSTTPLAHVRGMSSGQDHEPRPAGVPGTRLARPVPRALRRAPRSVHRLGSRPGQPRPGLDTDARLTAAYISWEHAIDDRWRGSVLARQCLPRMRGFWMTRSGKRPKSRSALHNVRTPFTWHRVAIRASWTIGPRTFPASIMSRSVGQ